METTKIMNPFKFQRFVYEQDGRVFVNEQALHALPPNEDIGCGKNRDEFLKWLKKLSYMPDKIQIRNVKGLIKKTQRPQKIDPQMSLFT